MNFLLLAAPFVVFAGQSAEVDPLDEPKRALGMIAGAAAGAWVVLMLYGYVLITAFLTPAVGPSIELNLWAEMLVIFAPVLVSIPMYGVSEMIGAEV